jgi:outer membrane protein assembly factor BamB
MSYRAAPGLSIVVVAFGGKVFGIDADMGRRLWGYDSGTNGVVRVSVHEGRVYVLASNVLACLDHPTGRLVWHLQIPRGDSLLVAGERVIVGGAGEVRCYSSQGSLLWEDDFKGMGLGEVALAVPGASVQADRWG